MISLPNRNRLRAVAGTVVLALARLASAQAPAASEAVQRELQVVQDQLARATLEFEGSQQSRSIVLFDEVIARLESVQRQGPLPPRGRDLLAEAYERRGRAYFNIGLQEKASENFRLLVQLKPDHVISREKVSPKIVDLFNSVKKALVGYLAVSSKPAGAKVTLNGEFLSLTDFFPLEVLAGDYTVEVAREGYRTESRTVSIAPRATETLEVPLTRTSASAFFVTEPPGVEIWMDGALAVTTAGTLAPDFAAAVREKGLDPARASARTEIGGLSLGSHVVELRKKCHELVRKTVDFAEAKDYDLEPAKMEESLASLSLRSDPPGARIYLDGEAMGVTPKDLEGVCSGKHRVEVKHASGKFLQDVVLERNESLTLDCPIRPSLAFLGVVAESAGGERVAAEVQETLVRNLSKITSLNFVPAPRETVDRILEADRLARKGLLPGAGTDPDLIRKVTEKMAAALEVQGFLLALLPEERLQRTAALHLLAAGNTVSDRFDVAFNEAASYLRFLSVVDQRAAVYRPWTGIITVDTLLHDGVPILRVAAASPGAQAGLQPGEVIDAADSHAIKQTAELLALVRARKPKDRIALPLQ